MVYNPVKTGDANFDWCTHSIRNLVNAKSKAMWRNTAVMGQNGAQISRAHTNSFGFAPKQANIARNRANPNLTPKIGTTRPKWAGVANMGQIQLLTNVHRCWPNSHDQMRPSFTIVCELLADVGQNLATFNFGQFWLSSSKFDQVLVNIGSIWAECNQMLAKVDHHRPSVG